MAGSDFVKEVTPTAAFDWDPEDQLSRAWTIVKGDGAATEITRRTARSSRSCRRSRHRIVAYDFGMKRNILRRLRQEGFKVRVVPADTQRGGRARAEARRRLPLQRPRRSGGARLTSTRTSAS